MQPLKPKPDDNRKPRRRRAPRVEKLAPGVYGVRRPRVWGSVEKRRLGAHGPWGEVVWWDDDLPHAGFLRAVERVAPEVLGSLRADVLPGRVSLAAWADRWRLNVPWLCDAAGATLRTWRRQRRRGESLTPAWTLPVAGEVVAPTNRPPDRDSRANAATLDRLVRWHLLGWGHERIARREIEEAKGDDPKNPWAALAAVKERGPNVLAAVRALHRRLGLPPRPPGKPGRPSLAG